MQKSPIVSTERIANAFESLRWLVLLLMLAISVVAGYGYVHVPTADNAEQDAAEASKQ